MSTVVAKELFNLQGERIKSIPKLMISFMLLWNALQELPFVALFERVAQDNFCPFDCICFSLSVMSFSRRSMGFFWAAIRAFLPVFDCCASTSLFLWASSACWSFASAPEVASYAHFSNSPLPAHNRALAEKLPQWPCMLPPLSTHRNY